MVSIGTNLIGNLGKIVNNPAGKPAAADSAEGAGFKDALNEALERFENIGDENAQSTFDLITGNTDDLSSTLISSQKSEIAVSLTVALRNKAVDAYKEIMNMQV